ncbi:MAG: hypothetical protein HYY52_00230 [Candidatus Melainabacteria bacterium]|nr:hypothetical protein [Candidatus Melainabacteria bacterium]
MVNLIGTIIILGKKSLANFETSTEKKITIKPTTEEIDNDQFISSDIQFVAFTDPQGKESTKELLPLLTDEPFELDKSRGREVKKLKDDKLAFIEIIGEDKKLKEKEEFTYDKLGRLKERSVTKRSNNGLILTTVDFDANGKRIFKYVQEMDSDYKVKSRISTEYSENGLTVTTKEENIDFKLVSTTVTKISEDRLSSVTETKDATGKLTDKETIKIVEDGTTVVEKSTGKGWVYNKLETKKDKDKDLTTVIETKSHIKGTTVIATVKNKKGEFVESSIEEISLDGTFSEKTIKDGKGKVLQTIATTYSKDKLLGRTVVRDCDGKIVKTFDISADNKENNRETVTVKEYSADRDLVGLVETENNIKDGKKLITSKYTISVFDKFGKPVESVREHYFKGVYDGKITSKYTHDRLLETRKSYDKDGKLCWSSLELRTPGNDGRSNKEIKEFYNAYGKLKKRITSDSTGTTSETFDLNEKLKERRSIRTIRFDGRRADFEAITETYINGEFAGKIIEVTSKDEPTITKNYDENNKYTGQKVVTSQKDIYTVELFDSDDKLTSKKVTHKDGSVDEEYDGSGKLLFKTEHTYNKDGREEIKYNAEGKLVEKKVIKYVVADKGPIEEIFGPNGKRLLRLERKWLRYEDAYEDTITKFAEDGEKIIETKTVKQR